MRKVLDSIYTQLAGSTLNSSTYANGRIYYGEAPQNTTANSTTKTAAKFPYIVYNKISEEKKYTQKVSTNYAASTVETFLFQIDIYDNDTSAITLETMADLLDDLFNLFVDDFTITGYVLMYPPKKTIGSTIKTQDNNWRHMSRYELQAQRS